jgi:hypothetical protein
MIQVKTSIHDRFSVEFKINFSGKEQQHRLFKMNSWLFVPNSLNINTSTYSKEQFYQDVKSNVRLKTPQFTLQQLADAEALTVRNLSAAVQKYAENPSPVCMQDLEFHIKMYVAIYKSALRDETKSLQAVKESAFNPEAWRAHLIAMRKVVRHYREVMRNNSESSSEVASIFQYGDEYMSHLTELHAVRLMRSATALSIEGIADIRQEIKLLIVEEHQYKIDQGYAHFSLSNIVENRDMFQHQNMLKKYIESALYLKSDSEPDGSAAREITLSFTAGLAMLISMLIALPFQKYLGQYPILIFVILVVAYMFKDRIKEYTRNHFAHRLKSRFFDMKNKVYFRGKEVVKIKEGMDFIDDQKTPDEVMQTRNRSDLENRIPLEQIILYRKQVEIDNELLGQRYEYRYDGINDITRIHLQHFTTKMDDPETNVAMLDSNGEVHTMKIPRVYNLHIVLQCVAGDMMEYHCFRLMMCRDGIVECVEI